MGFGSNIKEREIKRNIWYLNSQIKKNKNNQIELIKRINNIEETVKKMCGDSKEFIQMQIDPLENKRYRLRLELQSLLQKKIESQKAIQKYKQWVSKK